MRQIFQKLHKEKAKKAVCVWTCCELLRMYFKLGQVRTRAQGLGSRDGCGSAQTITLHVDTSLHGLTATRCETDSNAMRACIARKNAGLLR